MNEDGPNGSPYETLAKHDQSETKHDSQTQRGTEESNCQTEQRSHHKGKVTPILKN
jgi:hypothetical protein